MDLDRLEKWRAYMQEGRRAAAFSSPEKISLAQLGEAKRRSPLPPISQEANASKAHEHHRPRCGFRHGREGDVVDTAGMVASQDGSSKHQRCHTGLRKVGLRNLGIVGC